MSADNAHGAPYAYDGVSFPRVTMKGYATLESALRDKRRAQAKAIATDCELGGEAKARSIREAESQPVTMYDVDDFTHTGEGIRLALRQSLALAGKAQEEADSIIDKLDPNDARIIARVVLGFVELKPKPEKPGPKGSGVTEPETGSSSTPPSDSTTAVTPQA